MANKEKVKEKVPKIENVPVDTLAENFVARHFKHILFFSLGIVVFSLLIVFFTVNKYASLLYQNQNVINNLSNKVIMVRPDGAVAILSKKPVSAEVIRYVLRNVILNDVPLSAFDLQHVTTEKQFFELPKVKNVLIYLTKSGLNGYNAYKDMLITYYNAGKLPEIITSYDYQNMHENLLYQRDGSFQYTLSIPINFMYVSPTLTWQNGYGTMSVVVEGYTNMLYGTPENPFGIRITNFEVKQYISKPYVSNLNNPSNNG